MLAPRKRLWSTPKEAVAVGMGLLALRPDDTVIDIGCGNGSTLVEGARLAPGGTQFVGYEIVEERAEEARALVAAEGLSERITIHTGNVLDHKFGEEAIAAFAGKKFFLFLTTHGLLKLLPFFRAAAARGGGPVEVVSAMYPIKGEKHIKSVACDVGDFRWRLFHYRFAEGGPSGCDTSVLDAGAGKVDVDPDAAGSRSDGAGTRGAGAEMAAQPPAETGRGDDERKDETAHEQ